MRNRFFLFLLTALAAAAFAGDGELSSKEFSTLKKKIAASLEAGDTWSARSAIEELAADQSFRAIDLLLDVVVKVPDAGIQQTCIETIAQIDNEDADAELLMQMDKGKGGWQARVVICDAMALRNDPTSLDILVLGLADREDTVQRAALMAVKQRNDQRALDGVIALMEREEPKEGILFHMSRELLEEMTGERFSAAVDWKNWWSSARDDFDPREVTGPAVDRGHEETELRNPDFFGTEIGSKRIAFLIDTSGSMLEIDPLPSTTGGDDRVATGDKERELLDAFGLPPEAPTRMRIDRAKHELQRVIALLDKDVRFTILAYNGAATMNANGQIDKGNTEAWLQVWKNKLTSASSKNKKDAIGFVQTLEADGATFTNSVIENAFQIPDADTYYLLSDGIPTEPTEDGMGQIGTDDILANVQNWNRLRKIVIHTFGFEGDGGGFGGGGRGGRGGRGGMGGGFGGGSEDFVQFLKDLADQNGGSYKSIE